MPDDNKESVKTGSIKVIVRARPVSDTNRVIVENLDERILVFDPSNVKALNNFNPNRSQSAGANKQKSKFTNVNRSNSAGRNEKSRSGVPSHPLIKARGRSRHKEHKFAFDHVFGPDSCQEGVYHESVKPLVGKLLEGYNCSCLCYGATGAGKTYTMSGTNTKPGIMYRAVNEIYNTIGNETEKVFEVFVNFCEVYNERIHDLLKVKTVQAPVEPEVEKPIEKPKSTLKKQNRGRPKTAPSDKSSKKSRSMSNPRSLSNLEDKTKKIPKPEPKDKRPDLQIMEKNGEVMIQGLSMHRAPQVDSLMSLLNFGNKNRTQHATDANEQSSRSHAVFTIFVRQKDKTAKINSTVTTSKLVLVDLAGSERAAKVTAGRGANRLKEGANINRSLLALGSVINALAEQSKKLATMKLKGIKGKMPKAFVNYRDSKLTRIIKDVLGGNCFTVMIANIAPTDSTYEDTWNTLCYANRAKNIKSSATKSQFNVDASVAHYKEINIKQCKEIEELKIQIKDMQAILDEKDKIIENCTCRIEHSGDKKFPEDSTEYVTQTSNQNSDEDSDIMNDSDATFILTNTPKLSRTTPYRNITRSGKKSIQTLPPHLLENMNKVIKERKKILKRAFGTCSELRSANLNTVIRTLNNCLKEQFKSKQTKHAQWYSDDIQLQISGKQLINAKSKSNKLSSLDGELDENSDTLRNLTLQLQSLADQSFEGSSKLDKFNRDLHPANVNLFIELQTLKLDIFELNSQQGHLGRQIDKLFHAWQSSVKVNLIMLEAFNLYYKMINFHSMITPNISDKYTQVQKVLGVSVDFAKIGLEQTRLYEVDPRDHGDATFTVNDSSENSLSSFIPDSEEEGEKEKDSECTSIENHAPLRGLSSTLCSLFHLPNINSATEKISCQDWVVDDKLLKKLVFEGLNSKQSDNEEEVDRVGLFQNQRRKNRRSLANYKNLLGKTESELEDCEGDDVISDKRANLTFSISPTKKLSKNLILNEKDLNFSIEQSPRKTIIENNLEDKENDPSFEPAQSDDTTFVITKSYSPEILKENNIIPPSNKKFKQSPSVDT